ncbi:hypothetical protein QBC47DRAFT_90018 [Echria macrotheca]|uniref:Uncharacterized protein n=1 Tax=Echria macrotheca TaxID=438768 RepID=A0AAJ0F2C4_9PEZI|nr:hypothetical protein QBC47DRAFT_90018 [Echria macrotheca]
MIPAILGIAAVGLSQPPDEPTAQPQIVVIWILDQLPIAEPTACHPRHRRLQPFRSPTFGGIPNRAFWSLCVTALHAMARSDRCCASWMAAICWCSSKMFRWSPRSDEVLRFSVSVVSLGSRKGIHAASPAKWHKSGIPCCPASLPPPHPTMRYCCSPAAARTLEPWSRLDVAEGSRQNHPHTRTDARLPPAPAMTSSIRTRTSTERRRRKWSEHGCILYPMSVER